MSEQQKKSDPWAIALFVLGAVTLSAILTAALLKIAPASPHADQGFTRELRPGGGPVEVGDFGTLEIRQAGGLKVVYTLPEWLRGLHESQRWTLVKLEHRRNANTPWASWGGLMMPRTAAALGREGFAPWLVCDDSMEAPHRVSAGEAGCVAMATPMALCPFYASETFYVRIAVRDETQQWSFGPTVPVTLHAIRRFGDRR